MIELGVACDGGKDSLSMAAAAGGETVMAPGNLVVSAYVGCPDITKVLTPDLKLGDDGVLLHVDLATGKRRLGGSALAQAYNQVPHCTWHTTRYPTAPCENQVPHCTWPTTWPLTS
jgi:phosphoribosylformylglycinamidine synthase